MSVAGTGGVNFTFHLLLSMPADPVQQLLDPQTISRAESLGLAARVIVEGYMAGEHKSPYRGFAIPPECVLPRPVPQRSLPP